MLEQEPLKHLATEYVPPYSDRPASMLVAVSDCAFLDPPVTGPLPKKVSKWRKNRVSGHRSSMLPKPVPLSPSDVIDGCGSSSEAKSLSDDVGGVFDQVD